MRIRILPILITVLIAGLAFIFVHQVLAAPQLDVNTGITVDEGSLNNTITNLHLEAIDPDNLTAVFTYTILTPPQRGNLTGGGSFTQDYIDGNSLKYTHHGSETITDSFEFNVTNGVTVFITGTFNITITPVNDPPNANPDAITVSEGGTTTTLSTPLNATSVISNDTDIEGDALTVALDTGPSYTSLFTLNSDGTFSYTHNGSENHSDSFTYTICDDGTPSECDTTTVTIIITPVNDPPSLTITGTPIEDETLTANLSDGDGLPDPAEISYQWQRRATGSDPWADITGATNDTYTLDDPDVGNHIRVTAAYTDTQNTLEEPESASIGPIANINDTPSLTITGAPTENVTLSATLSDGDGYEPGSVNYQWERSETGSAPWIDINGATSSTYTLDDVDVGDHIRVTATYTDDHGAAESLISNAVGPVANVNDPPSFTLNGSQIEDETLTTNLTDDDGYDPGSVTYQWQRRLNGSPTWTDINGETSSTYILGDDDAGNFVRVTATYTDTHGTLESPTATSGQIVNVNDIPVLTISGIETEDETLTAILTDDDGLTGVTVSYQWQRSNNGTSNWQNISGATSSTYTLGDLDAYRFIRVTATYTDQQGTTEEPDPPATGAIANVNDTPVAIDDNFFISEGQSATSINVITHKNSPTAPHDHDVDLFDTLTTSIVTPPNHAAFYSLATNGSLQYTHDGLIPGSTPILDTIEYEVCDNGTPVKCARATVNITITPFDDRPTAVPDTYYLLEGASITANVTDNDYDEEDDLYVVFTPVISPPSHAVAFNFTNTGSFTYEHSGTENFNDNFIYRICREEFTDINDDCTQTTVTLVITPTNDAPTTSPDIFTVPRSETLDTQTEPGQKTVLANDTDAEGDDMTVNTTPVTLPTYAASFTLNADGSFIYVHNDLSDDDDSFSYEVCDDGTPVECSIETVTINIGPRPTSFVYLPTILNNYSPDEPNNSPCTAYPIGLNSQYSFTPNDTEDWYRITLPSTTNLTVQMSNFLLQGDLIVYRSADCVIDGSDEVKNDGTSQSSKTVNWASAPAGTYFIRVYTSNPNPNAQSYNLIVSAP